MKKNLQKWLLVILTMLFAIPYNLSAATNTYDFIAAREAIDSDVTITSSGNDAGKNGMGTSLVYPKELSDVFKGNFAFFFRNECTVKLTSEGLTMTGSKDTYISILNLKNGDKVTVEYTGSCLFCDNPVTNIEGVTSQWSSCASGTEYTLTADGNFNIQWKKSKTVIKKIVVETTATETVSTPGIEVTGVNGINRTVTITPGLGSFGSATSTYYTLDGNDPTNASDLYTAPISISEAKTVKAISMLADGTASSIASLEVAAGTTIKLSAYATITDITDEGSSYKFSVTNTNLIGNPEITYSYSFNDGNGTGDSYTANGTGTLCVSASAEGYETSDVLEVQVIEYEVGESLVLNAADVLEEDDAAWTYNSEGTRYANWSGYNGVSKASYPYWTPTTDGKGTIGNFVFEPGENVLMRTVGFIHNSGTVNFSLINLPENTTVKFVVSVYGKDPVNHFVDAVDGVATYALPAGNTGYAVESVQFYTKIIPIKSIFLKPGLWNADGARYAAYVWNDNGNKWFDFAAAEEEGVYTVAIPESYTGLILARMNGATEENNWDNKWNQTSDINFNEVADSTLFTITDWSAYESSKYVKAESALNTYTATFTTNQNWEKVYAYAWTGEGESTVKFLGDWPGTELTANEGVYTVTIQAAEAPAKIIFNSGAGVQTEDLAFENGKAYEYNKEDSELMAKAKALAADAEAVAVGKLNAAITAALSTGDDSNLQAAIDQFKADNADMEKDETAKVATNGWKKFTGNDAAGVCATQFAPAIDTYDGRKNVQLAENYETTVETTGTIIYQDITGLANGSYKVGFYGNAFFTSGRGFESTMEDGATDVAYVFANDQKEFITARVATSTTENNYRQFNVEVTDGTIKLGMGKEKPGTNWHTMQIHQLTWFTTAKAAYAAVKAEMETEIAAAKALKTESRTAGVDDFNAAIEAAEATLTSNMLNVTEFENEVANLKAAAAAFKKANWYIDFAAGEYYIIDTEGGKMMAAGHDYGTRGIVNEMGLDLTITPYTESRTVTIDSRVANGNNHFLGENLYMDSSEWGWALEYQGFGFYILEPKSGKYINLDEKDNLVLSDTPREFIIVTKEGVMAQRMEELAAATAENPVDATFLIQGANFNRNDQRNSAWTVSEDCTNKNLSGGADANRCAESYHSTFTISQAISGAPAGKYTLTAQGFFRQDKNANEVDTVETTPIFFIGDKTAEVPAKTGTEDNMKQASESFTAGQYTIEPIEFVYNGEGDLVVGIKNETAKYQWIIFDNFQLTYYGAKAEEPAEIDKFYIMGTGTANAWDGTTEMTYNEETQAFEYTVEGESGVWIAFGDAAFTDWDDFNANHRYAIGNGDQNATVGEAMQLQKVNGTLALAAGKYNISVTKDLLCTITEVVAPATHTWDFTKWSEETVANLKADAAASKLEGWSDVEKQADAEAGNDPTEASKDNCFWYIGGEAQPTANGVAIAEFTGLEFNTTYGTKRSLAIAVNYPVALSEYAGPSYLWFGGKNSEIMTIKNVKAGTQIKMGVESHKTSDARGVQLFVDGTELTDPEGAAVAAPTTYTEQTWQVPAGEGVVDVVVKNTNGCHIYFIDAEIGEPVETIETMYIVGELTGGWPTDDDWSNAKAMTQDAENAAVWTLTVEGFEAEAKTYKYKATANAKWGLYELPASGDNTFDFGTEEYPAGKYNLLFTVNTTDGTLTLVPTKVVPDGINSIAADRMNGTIYNLNGQKVLKAQKGLYIINGKKTMVK